MHARIKTNQKKREKTEKSNENMSNESEEKENCIQRGTMSTAISAMQMRMGYLPTPFGEPATNCPGCLLCKTKLLINYRRRC